MAHSVSETLRLGPGAHVREGGVSYRVWAPDHPALSVRIERIDGTEATLPLERDGEGFFQVNDPAGRTGDRYGFLFADGALLPDPASRFQPDGVHAMSECIDPRAYEWRCTDWRRPGWRGQSIYELHVGTFTPEGTFRAAIARLDHVASLGVEAIELMPVADFNGDRNWGYDGVALYAPARCYGRPDELRALVDAAHARGLAVILDAVYNHLGPSGSYLARFARAYFHPARHTAWGQALNFSGADSGPVRDFFAGNARYWLDEFRFDGLRLDATHAIEDDSPRHIVAEIAAAAHERGAFVIAEDERNSCEVTRRTDGEGWRLDAGWADDFHHEMQVALTGERTGYLQDYAGSSAELARTIAQGWFYTGQPYSFWENRPRGEACTHLPPNAFVFCIENHDQVGNRARGERLEQLVPAAAFRAASALLLLSPYPPLIFMGQEWAADTPFLFFSNHGGDLGASVSKGRKREFRREDADDVPDPEAVETFARSKLRWEETGAGGHAAALELYRACLRQRKTWLRGAACERAHWRVLAFEGAVAIFYRPSEGQAERLLVSSLGGSTSVAWADLDSEPGHGGWRVEVASGEIRAEADALGFAEPATVLLVRAEGGEGGGP